MSKVSVIIPTYNCAKYLPEAIDSVLKQTYQDFEIIVIDDGSTDNTNQIIAKYTERYRNQIKYFYQKNKGPAAARNVGIKEARSDFIAFLDADDKYLPQYLETCINFLSVNINYDVVATEWYQVAIDDKGDEVLKDIKGIKDFPESSKELYKSLFFNFFLNSYMVAKKTSFNNVGYFDENISQGEDLDMWRRFAKNDIKIGLIPKPLFIYHKRANSLTTSKNFQKLVERFKLIEKYKRVIASDPSLRKHYSEVLWDFGRQAFYLKGKPSFIFKCMLQSQIYRPSLFRILKSFYSSILIKNFSFSKF